MKSTAPSPRPCPYSAPGFALLLFGALAILLPTAIFPWSLPEKPLPPRAVEPARWPPPKLDASVPTVVQSGHEAEIDAPALVDPDPRPKLDPLDIRLAPFVPPDGGIAIDGLYSNLPIDVLPDSWEFLDQPPEVLFQPAPRVSRRLHSRMAVLAELIVEKNGQVSEVRILSADADELAAAVVSAAVKWRFAPGIKDGVPVRFRMRQRFDFQP